MRSEVLTAVKRGLLSSELQRHVALVCTVEPRLSDLRLSDIPFQGRFTLISDVSVPYQYRPFSASARYSHVSGVNQFRISALPFFSSKHDDCVFCQGTVVIALLLDEEEKERDKNKFINCI
jgi:hypothetical protein